MSTVSGKASRRRRLNKAKRANVVFWVSVCSVLAAVLGAGIWAWQTDAPARIIETIVGALDDAATAAGLTVADVTLSGREHAARAELIAALGVARGENMLRIDPGAVRARLENLGWVEKAAVARRLPGQIRIHITERRPFALWQRDGALFLIDRAGVVVTDHDLDAFADLPVIVGGEAAARAGDLMDMAGGRASPVRQGPRRGPGRRPALGRTPGQRRRCAPARDRRRASVAASGRRGSRARHRRSRPDDDRFAAARPPCGAPRCSSRVAPGRPGGGRLAMILGNAP